MGWDVHFGRLDGLGIFDTNQKREASIRDNKISSCGYGLVSAVLSSRLICL